MVEKEVNTMKRDIYKQLVKWKNSHKHKPILLEGMHQCGKTYVVNQLGKEFTYYHYIDLEHSPIVRCFEPDLNPQRIIHELEDHYFKEKIIPNKTLIFFDHIYDCPQVIPALKHFHEEMPELHIIVAVTSLQSLITQNKLVYQIGEVMHLYMYPLTFKEFLIANGKEKYINGLSLRQIDQPLPELLTNPLNKMFTNYCIIGGMPEAVETWITTHDYAKVSNIQKQIIRRIAYHLNKEAPVKDISKIHMIYNSIPSQLFKKNDKFMFAYLKKGARYSAFTNALDYLVSIHLIHKLDKVNSHYPPLTYDQSYFKLYIADIGLMRLLSNIDYHDLLENSPAFKAHRGDIYVNYGS